MKDDAVDIIEFMKWIWDGKFLILLVTLISFSLGSVYIYTSNHIYESKFLISHGTLPPFKSYVSKKPLLDFKRMFHLESNFQNWKNKKDKIKLNYENITDLELISGVYMLKSKSNREVFFDYIKKKEGDFNFIKIRSNDLIKISQLHEYANYTIDRLTQSYLNRSIVELNLLKKEFKNLTTRDYNPIGFWLDLDRYISSVSQGSKVFTIKQGTYPERIFPKYRLTIFISILFGGIISFIILIFKNMYFVNRKK